MEPVALVGPLGWVFTNKNEIFLRGKNKAFLVSFNDIC